MAAATSKQEMLYLIKFLLKNNNFDKKEKAAAIEEINIPWYNTKQEWDLCDKASTDLLLP